MLRRGFLQELDPLIVSHPSAHNLGGRVRRVAVHDHDLEALVVLRAHRVQAGSDVVLLVACRDHDRHQLI